MTEWNAALKLDAEGTRVLLSDRLGHDVLKARLPLQCGHPRALLTLLEGAALYCGDRLLVVTSVDESADPGRVETVLGGHLLSPIDSALVRFDFVGPPIRRRRLIRGVGDFRDLRCLQLPEGHR